VSLHRITRSAALISSAASLLLVSSAGARTITFVSPTARAISCSLSVNHSLLESIATENAASATMVARVSPHAAPGTYRVTFACSPYKPQVQRVKVAHHKGRTTRGSLLTSFHFGRQGSRPNAAAPSAKLSPAETTPAPPLPLPPSPFLCVTAACPTLPVIQTPTLTALALKEASSLWASWEVQFTQAVFHGGQCTELADAKRPDIITHVMETVIAENIMAGANPYPAPPLDWDAQMWDANAAKAGMSIGTAPHAGAIMVFHESEYNHATRPGHVAYVNSVGSDGSINVTEEHAPELWVVDNRTFTPSEVAIPFRNDL